MSTAPHISIEHVSKRYKRNMTSFQSIISYLLGKPSPDNFWAVDDVSFSLSAGDALGIIGINGAGKSTLLKIITGITKPTRGTVMVHGRVGALIEVGAGFHPELTGRENIFFYGAILGMKRSEIRSRFDEIVAFSGLSSMLDTPVKFYSSGMYLRLGFAVTVFTDPDILIVDEALAVGDAAFQQKCLDKIEEFRSKDKIVILVSHDLRLIERYTKTSLLLRKGAIAYEGPSRDATAAYLKEVRSISSEAHTSVFENPEKETYISQVQLRQDGIPNATLSPQTNLACVITIKSSMTPRELLLGVAVFRDGVYLFGTKQSFMAEKGTSEVTLSIPDHPFLAGRYSLTVGVWERSTDQEAIDFRDPALTFMVHSSQETEQYDGYILVPHTFS